MKSLMTRALLSLAVVSIFPAGCLATGEEGDQEGEVEEASSEEVGTSEQAIAACVDSTDYEEKRVACPGPGPEFSECVRPCVTERHLEILPPTPGGPLAECVVEPRHCYPWICSPCPPTLPF